MPSFLNSTHTLPSASEPTVPASEPPTSDSNDETKQQIRENVKKRAEKSEPLKYNAPVIAEVGESKLAGWKAKGAARAEADQAKEEYNYVIFNNGSAGDGTATFSFGGSFDEVMSNEPQKHSIEA